ncbi:MAG: hypothetical protein RL754_1028 [Bacteroidota bacterium]|jgi:hypothetical protein
MNPTIKTIGVKFGAYYGLVSIVYALYAYLFDANIYNQAWTGILFFLLSVGIYMYAVAKVKKEFGGYITFKEAFSTFMVAAVVATAISTVFSMLLFGVIDPQYADLLFENTKEMMYNRLEGANLPEEKVAEILATLDERNPFTVGSLVRNFFFGVAFSAIIGLIVSAAMKKNNPELG